MIIYVFGNPDLPSDALPIKILPTLKKKFPQIIFELKDPNEEFDIPEELIIMDTVEGIKEIKIFSELESFVNSPRVSLHDFDLLSNLKFLKKLGKLKKLTIIGAPKNLSEKKALEEITATLQSILP